MSEIIENSAAENTEQSDADINILKKIRLEKLDELKANGKNPFEITKFDVTAHNSDIRAQYERDEAAIKEQAGEDEEKLKELLEANRRTVRIAGRIMSWRDMGKANFIDVRDKTDRMQIYLSLIHI